MQLLYETVKLRAESIEGQLNGTIPSTDAGQRQDSSALIDASHIDIKAMGQFNMGGSFGGGSDKNADTSDVGEGSDTSSLPGGFDTSGLPEGFSTSGRPEFSDQDNTSEDSDQTSTHKERPASFSGMPGQSPGMSSGVKKNAVTYGICLAVMIAALFIISRCKRRK